MSFIFISKLKNKLNFEVIFFTSNNILQLVFRVNNSFTLVYFIFVVVLKLDLL